jgi:hypothetical protein
MTGDNEKTLVAEYEEFLKAANLPSMSADELIVEIWEGGWQDAPPEIRWKLAYLNTFIFRWENVV